MDTAFTGNILHVYKEGAMKFQLLWVVKMPLKIEFTTLSKTPNTNPLRKQLNDKSNLFCLYNFSEKQY